MLEYTCYPAQRHGLTHTEHTPILVNRNGHSRWVLLYCTLAALDSLVVAAAAVVELSVVA